MEAQFLFAELFNKSLPDDPNEAGRIVAAEALTVVEDANSIDACFDALALMRALAPKYGWNLNENNYGVHNAGDDEDPDEPTSIYLTCRITSRLLATERSSIQLDSFLSIIATTSRS